MNIAVIGIHPVDETTRASPMVRVVFQDVTV